MSALSVSLHMTPRKKIDLEDKKAVQIDLDRLDQRTKANCVRLTSGHSNSMQYYRLGAEWLKSCTAEKDPGMLVNSPLNLNQHYAQVTKKANDILACIRNGVDSSTRDHSPALSTGEAAI